MTRDSFYKNTGILYALFLSGILFYGVPIDGDLFLSRLFGMTFCFLALYAVGRFFPAGFAGKEKQNPVLSAVLLIFCLWSAGSLFYELSREMPQISDVLSGGRFSHFFWILSLVLTLYITSDGTLSLSRTAFLLLPALFVSPVLTCFSFLGYEGELPSFMPEHSFSFRFSYFTDSVSFFGILFFYLAVHRKKEGEKKEERRAFSFAFLLFLLTFFIESVKVLLYFGARGAAVLPRPDRTLLSVVPYLNVQEIFLFTYYFSFILRLGVLICAARYSVKEFFHGVSAKKIQSCGIPLLTGVLVYGAFLLTQKFPILSEKAYLAPLLYGLASVLFSSGKIGIKDRKKAE